MNKPMPVRFRLPADASVGYLELFPAPWSQDRAVLAVLGSTVQGVQWAGVSLTLPELRGQLANNLAIIQEQQIVVSGQIMPVGDLAAPQPVAAGVPPVTTTAVVENTPTPIIVPAAVSPQQPSWLVPTMIASGGLMGLIVVSVVISALWQSRRSRLK